MMEGGRKWEELQVDSLVNVLGRVGVESLIMDIPFVCKSWYTATLDPLCWRTLRFSDTPVEFQLFPKNNTRIPKLKKDPQFHKFKDGVDYPITAFIKYVVNRSHGCAELVELPFSATDESLEYVADKCRELKVVMPSGLYVTYFPNLPSLVCKWKQLEFITLGSYYQLPEILTQIRVHCNNFNGLSIKSAIIGEEQASSIVATVPNIKYLGLRSALLPREDLVTILQGCKQLVELDVRECIGFEEDDEYILKLASHISKFMSEGSTLRYGDEHYRIYEVPTCSDYYISR